MDKKLKSNDSKGSREPIKKKKKTKSEKLPQKNLYLISKKDFGQRCGLSPGNLSNYIKRGEVIITDKKIDVTLPKNIGFLDKRLKKLDKTHQDRGIDHQIKQVELEKKTQETRLLKLKEQKTLGVLIPTEMVKILFTHHTKSILTEFDNSIDRILTKISKIKKLTNEERSKLRGELKKELNTAVDKTIDASKRKIKRMVFEYTEVRGVGERE